ncbi:hypothetical protein [Thermogymnomonas acidicola]|uniref:hypothetical protein n=1 Tax=Thermogymnomonas acidicola TaxID=399579 RepID=UPI00139687D7|nr:hypothetical protein [Thermogymnomonas acidicola]
MKELGLRTHALFFNESGGHWRTALPAYRFYQRNFQDVHRVWSNVDRFYWWFLRRLRILDEKVAFSWADSYPIQLFTFPVYIMAFLPVVMANSASSILIGDEFDDPPRGMEPYRGISHFHEIFDQTKFFNDMFTSYLRSKGIGGVSIWSALHPISGSVVEKILIHRYHDLYRLQRSCHSCHYENGDYVPCGRCSKCLGVMLFILSSGGDPREIGYGGDEDIGDLESRVRSTRMRLDPDELEYAVSSVFHGRREEGLSHVDGIHLLDGEEEPFSYVDSAYRESIYRIVKQYTDGVYRLSGQSWERVS